MLCLYVLSIGGTYSVLGAVIFLDSLALSAAFSQRKDVCSRWLPTVLLSLFCVLELLMDIVVLLDTVTPSDNAGQRKAPSMSRVSEKVLFRWKVARDTGLADIPTAAPIRATADKAT
jgi:hypothetical protein